MPSKDDLVKDLDWTTQRVSDRVWSISAGTIAIALGYFVEAGKATGEPFLKPELAAGPAAIALLSLVFDLGQYLAANRSQYALFAQMERRNVSQLDFDADETFYKIRDRCYRAKICLCLVASLLLTLLTGWRVLELIGR